MKWKTKNEELKIKNDEYLARPIEDARRRQAA
jgi:hypothetical protein